MVESTQSNQLISLEESKQPISEIQLFLSEQSLEIPEAFTQRFVNNYEHRDIWVQSEQLFEWYSTTHKSDYNQFCVNCILKLPQTDFTEQTPISGVKQKGRPKKHYIVSQKGVKRIMMQSDEKTQDYFIQLEELMFQFVEWKSKKQQQESAKQLALKDAEIKALKYKNPESVYLIYDKRTGRLLYIGSDLSALQNRRYQHLSNRLTIIMSKHQLIDTYLATMDIQDIEIKTMSCEPGTAKDKETQMIKELKPEFNIRDSVNSKYICLCQPAIEYVNRVAYEKHMQQKHPQIQEDVEQTNTDFQDLVSIFE